MQNEKIPSHIHLENLNPHINLDTIPIRIPTKLEKWEKLPGKPRIAGVSSFGITGTNAHIILQESPKYTNPSLELDIGDRSAHIFTFSAKTESNLDDILDSYVKYLEANPDCNLADLAFTCNTGRAHFPYRAAITAGNTQELCHKLASSSERKVQHALENKPQICFLFTGQGSQFIGMAKSLYNTCPVFRMNFDYCDRILQEKYKIAITPVIWDHENSEAFQRSLYSQVSIFCVEYSLMKLWESWGIRPDVVIGHSLGEFCAAVCADILSVEDALALVANRSLLIEEKAPAGKMIVLKADKKTSEGIMQKFIVEHPTLWLDYAAFNSADQTVLAGPPDAVQTFKEFCRNAFPNLKTYILEASSAFHSRDMEHILPEYIQVVANVKLYSPKLPYISGVTGNMVKSDEVITSDYWIRHTREPVHFLDASKVAHEYGCRLFLEVGPQPILCALAMANIGCNGETLTLLPSIRKSEHEWNTLLESLGKLYQLGFEIDWQRLDQFCSRKKLHLPTYPFSRRKHWYETKESQQGIVFNTKTIHPLLGCQIPNATSNSIFHSTVELDKLAYLKDHSIGGHVVFPAAGFLEMCLSSGCLSTTGQQAVVNPMSVENLKVEAPLGMTNGQTIQLQTVVSKPDNADITISVFTQKTTSNDSASNATSSIKWIRQAVSTFVPLQVNYKLGEEMDALQEIKCRCHQSADTSEFYESLIAVGLEFGTKFRSLKKLWKNPNEREILTEINLAADDHCSTYMTHPIVLDALIQTIMIGIKRNNTNSLFVPLVIGKVIIFRKSQNQQYYAHCSWADGQSPESRSATLYDANGNIIACMENVQMIETKADTIVKNLTNQKIEIPNMYEELWRSKMGPLKNRTDLKILHGENLFGKDFANELTQCHKQTQDHIQMVANRKKLVFCYILKAFYELGWKPEINQKLNLKEFISHLNILPNQEKLIHRYLDILYEEGILSKKPWKVVQLPNELKKVEDDIAACVNFIRNHPQETGDAKVTIGCGERLATFLTGKESALSFLFPEDKTTEVCAETFYNESITVNAAHVALTSTLRKIMENQVSLPEEQRGVIRFLEIGAGTGSTTKHVLPVFDKFKAKYQYTYTDISPAFFVKARPMFESYGQKFQYKVLNIEEDPLAQGFIPQHYDIVLASNVLHATRDLAESVRHVRSLLKENGLLLLVETLQPIREYDVVFGLLDGFWRFHDYDIRPNYPCASGTTWEKVCKSEAYDQFNYFPCFGGQVGVVVSGASGINLDVAKTTSLQVANSQSDMECCWLVFADSTAFPNYLEKMFNQVRRKLIVVTKCSGYNFNPDKNQYNVRPDVKADFESIFRMIIQSKLKIEGIVYLWGLDEEKDHLKITTGFLYLAQILLSEFKGLPKFILVTEGIMPIADESAVNIIPSSLWGMVRSFRTEHFNLHVRSIDLDPDELDLQLKYVELFSEFWNDDLEFQIAYRQRSRHVCRLVQCKDFASPLSLPNSERYSLKLPETKNIADLKFCPNGKTLPKDNEVDVEVRATGLNFR